MSMPQVSHGGTATMEMKRSPHSPRSEDGGETPRYSFDIDMDAASDASSDRQEEALITAESPSSPGGDAFAPSTDSQGGDGSNKQWNYEDQFRQLYNLSPEAERKEFLDNLFDFMQKKGTPITRVPIMAKQPLDLYRLFKLVVERGGLVEVIKKKAWRNVAKELSLPASITSAAFTMRSQYVKYLYPFECEYKHLSDPQELQLAIESNKRDRRHSDNVEFSSPQPAPSSSTARPDTVRSVEQVAMGIPTTTYAMATSQGLQLITSPTMAIPHGSMPPYPGSFIIPSPGIRTNVSSTGQLMQMTNHLPIMMQAAAASGGNVKGERNEEAGSDGDHHHHQEGDFPPPTKRIALDLGGGGGGKGQQATGYIIGAHHTATPPTPHLLQMAHHPHQIITLGPQGSPMVTDARSLARVGVEHEEDHQGRKDGHIIDNNRVPIQHPTSFVISTSKGAQLVQAASSPQLVHMVTHPHLPIVMPAGFHPQFTTEVPKLTPPPAAAAPPPPPSQLGKPEQEGGAASTPSKPEMKGSANSSGSKMPFANISIQSNHTGKESSSDSPCDDSLLVTMEINNIIYQGVLFAKPGSTGSSPRR